MVDPVTPGSSDAALDGLPGPTHGPTPSGIPEQDQGTFGPSMRPTAALLRGRKHRALNRAEGAGGSGPTGRRSRAGLCVLRAASGPDTGGPAQRPCPPTHPPPPPVPFRASEKRKARAWTLPDSPGGGVSGLAWGEPGHLIRSLFAPRGVSGHGRAPQCLLQRATFSAILASAGRRASVPASSGDPGLRAPAARPGREPAPGSSGSFLCPSGSPRGSSITCVASFLRFGPSV